MAVKKMLSCFCWIQCVFLWVVLIRFQTTATEEVPVAATPGLPTVTVRGFLNFKTTVDGTVIVFTPASEVPPPSLELKDEKPSQNPFPSSTVPSNAFLEKEALNSQEGMHEGIQEINYASPPQNSLETIKTRVAELNIFDNKIKDPFLQHISDNAVLPSAGQINNDLDKIRKLQSSQNQYPTGLVTVLGGTFVEGTSTTVFETKVIGTYIDGKYAQILQSTSHIVGLAPSSAITTPSLTYSTVERSHSTENREFSNSILKAIPFSSSEKAFVSSLLTSKSKSIISSKIVDESLSDAIQSTPTVSTKEITETSTIEVIEKGSSQRINVIPMLPIDKGESIVSSVQNKQNDFLASSVALESSFVSTHSSISRDKDQPTETLESVKSSSVRKFTPTIPVTPTILHLTDDDNTVALSKVQRNNTSRTRFLSPRRPSQTVRLNRFKVKLTLRQDSSDEYNITIPADEEDMEEDHTHKGEDDVEVITEGIGISVDPARVVFQETTITSEVTLHVGRRKSVRTLTITTSVPLTVHPTDIQDILSSQSSAMDRADTDHHIVTRTFTTTERALKTSVVPIFDGKSTMYHTVTESFFIMKIITAYRTLPPGDPSVIESILDEPEISASTLEVAANTLPTVIQSAPTDQLPAEDTIQSSITVPSGNPQLQITNPLLSLGHALSNNPLAAVYLGLQQLNAQMTLYSTVTDVSTYVTTQTIYSTKTIRFYDGRSTRYRLMSDPISTKKSTVTTTITSVQPYLNTHAIQQQQQLQKLIAATQLSPPQLQYNTVTSTYTTVTTATSLSKRIYTLIYNGFSTKFRTVTSTTLYPTTVTVTSTTKIPIAPTPVNLPFAYPYTALSN